RDRREELLDANGNCLRTRLALEDLLGQSPGERLDQAKLPARAERQHVPRNRAVVNRLGNGIRRGGGGQGPRQGPGDLGPRVRLKGHVDLVPVTRFLLRIRDAVVAVELDPFQHDSVWHAVSGSFWRTRGRRSALSPVYER